MKKKQLKPLNKMWTKEGRDLGETPWAEYPRPAMRRNSFFCLNGGWDFAVKKANESLVYEGKIIVPFPPESLLSGVDQVFDEGVTLVYKKKFPLAAEMQGGRILLHFGAVDQTAKVFLNGALVCQHVGGYTPFSMDVTPHLQEENELVVEVKDELSKEILPYGKQCRKRGGMWYTPVSGIWQTVWMEKVPHRYIKSVNADVVGSFVKISIEGVEKAEVIVTTPNGELFFQTEKGVLEFSLEAPVFWSPENPYLYTYRVKTEEDEVESYFALRTLTIENVLGKPRLCLNGKPYFFHGLLDQGYFSDGIFTPATPKRTQKRLRA